MCKTGLTAGPGLGTVAHRREVKELVCVLCEVFTWMSGALYTEMLLILQKNIKVMLTYTSLIEVCVCFRQTYICLPA